jgi:thiol:disulfide interchange protein DsbD
MVLLGAMAPASVHGQTESAPIVTARTRATLLTEAPAVVPGTAVPVVLRLQLGPGWHTYWRNPGDSGEPATVTLRVGDRDVQGPDRWPVPERIDVGGIVSYGHHGDVLLVTTVPAEATRTAATALDVEATATWLVCEKVCVPEQGRFALRLPVAAPDTTARASAPDPQGLTAVTGLFATSDREWTLRLAATGPAGAGAPAEAYFFPAESNLIDHSAPQVMRATNDGMTLTMKPAPPSRPVPDALEGILSVTWQRADGARHTRSFELTARRAAEAR